MSTHTKPKLFGKVALVTGASKGIGASIALHLGEAGAAVVVNYTSSREGAERVAGQITQHGGRAVAVQADVSKRADIDRLFAETIAAFGRLDILVNNAGVYDFAPLGQITEAHFHRHFDVNVLGLLLATQKAVDHFDEHGGVIINVGSIVSTFALANGSGYSATKAAVDAITRSLAKELGARRIRVNSLNPGAVDTEGSRAGGIIGSDFEKQIIQDTPLGRTGQPDDIGRVAVFLASGDSGWITGETIAVAGGHPH
ncbi:SDR family NAD(P)-dependent oxidoreductase [Opitutus terrae]|uniref:Short-chain dehydrogenase/reductase SDR n=1 Tax=Opitutus terrae (strain DSM 11246 / JCM 15787 / PB90-1) TaxID=452637 RepID=B1ZYI9_OPITP|nr:glucose 1-dehydrogenase [Opitutus terrae]ACB77087.1 short-chain dehydrogenase/reductase SDR [Opitutus terrae PB90-1]